MARQTFTRVWGIPGYDEQHMAREDLTASLQPNLQAVVRCLRDQSELDPKAVQSAEQIGEARALQGVPVDAVMQSWATAERVVLDQLLSCAEELAVADLRIAVNRLGRVVGSLSRHSVDAYRRTQEEVTTHYDRLSTDLVARLTGEEPTDPDEIRRRARTIGVDPDAQYVALALRMQSASPQAYLRAQRHLLASVAGKITGRVLIGSIDEHPLILLPAPHGADTVADSVQAALADPHCPVAMLVALGDEDAQLPAVGEVSRNARDSLEVGRRLGLRGCLVRSRQVMPELLLIRNVEIAMALERRIAPLLDRPELLETLRTYLRCGLSARETARQLFVHPNTVPYRLRLIEKLLGRALVDVEQMSDILLAIRAGELTRSGVLHPESSDNGGTSN